MICLNISSINVKVLIYIYIVFSTFFSLNIYFRCLNIYFFPDKMFMGLTKLSVGIKNIYLYVYINMFLCR